MRKTRDGEQGSILCGKTRPGLIIPSGDELYLEFKSDISESHIGYKIKVQPSGKVLRPLQAMLLKDLVRKLFDLFRLWYGRCDFFVKIDIIFNMFCQSYHMEWLFFWTKFFSDYYEKFGYCEGSYATYDNIKQALNDCSQRLECKAVSYEYDYGKIEAHVCTSYKSQDWGTGYFLLMKSKLW